MVHSPKLVLAPGAIFRGNTVDVEKTGLMISILSESFHKQLHVHV